MPEILQLVEVFPGKYQVLLSCGHRVCCDRSNTMYDVAGRGAKVTCPVCSDRRWDQLRTGGLYYVRFAIEPYAAANLRFVSYSSDPERAIFSGLMAGQRRQFVVWKPDVFSIQEIPTL